MIQGFDAETVARCQYRIFTKVNEDKSKHPLQRRDALFSMLGQPVKQHLRIGMAPEPDALFQ